MSSEEVESKRKRVGNMLVRFVDENDELMFENCDFELQLLNRNNKVINNQYIEDSTITEVGKEIAKRYDNHFMTILDYGDELSGVFTGIKDGKIDNYKLVIIRECDM